MKRPLSLLEVVIALSLTTLLLTFLFSSYRDLIMKKVSLDTVREKLHPDFFIQTRLNQIFESLEEGTVFHTEDRTLNFRFDNGLDPDPEYCGNVNGQLFVTKKTLLLKIGDRTEKLKHPVKRLSFRFFDCRDQTWKEHWEGTTLPTFTQINIDGTLFSFNVPEARHVANY